MSPLRYQPEKVAVETAYVYEKPNVDGSHKSDIAQYVSSKDSLEAFKWTACESEATLVTAKMDWNCFSVRELSPGKIRADGERTQVAILDQAEDSDQMTVAGSLRSHSFQHAVTIENTPGTATTTTLTVSTLHYRITSTRPLHSPLE